MYAREPPTILVSTFVPMAKFVAKNPETGKIWTRQELFDMYQMLQDEKLDLEFQITELEKVQKSPVFSNSEILKFYYSEFKKLMKKEIQLPHFV